MEHPEPIAQQPEANVPQEDTEEGKTIIKTKWWYYQNSYKLATKRKIWSSWRIGDISRANGKLIKGLPLPKTLYLSMLGPTSSGKSSLSNTLLQHQESDTTTPQSVAAVGDGTSGVKTLTLGQYPCLDSQVMLVDTRGFNTSEFTQDDEDEVTKIGTGTLDNVRGQIYRKNDKRAAVTIVDSSAKDYSLIHLPIVVMAANASNEQQAVVTSMIDKVRQLGFAHILLVITKKSLDPVRAEEIKQNGFATIPKKDIYLIDNYPPDDVKEGTDEYLQFLRKQEEQAVDIMLACITLAEFNGLYNVPVIDTRALVKKYYERLTDKAKAYDLKFSLSSVFLSVLLFSVLYLLRTLVL